jgi:hypothetical protein
VRAFVIACRPVYWPAAALAAAVGFVLSLAPADPAPPGRTQEVEACLRTCDARDDETDRATCRLQCETSVQAKDEPNIIRWRRTEEIRGGFDGEPKQRRETTRVETASTPRGPTTTTTTTPSERTPPPSSSTAPHSPARSRYDALASCQSRCDPLQADSPRATCKLQCLRDPHGSHAPKPATPSKPVAAPKPTRPAPATTTPVETKANATDVAACRGTCSRSADTCRTGCSGQGSDRSTCELQCDQVASRCFDRCD